MVRVRGGEVKPSWALAFFKVVRVRGGEVKPSWVLAFFKVAVSLFGAAFGAVFGSTGFRLDGFSARCLFGAAFGSRGFRLDGSSARRVFGAAFGAGFRLGYVWASPCCEA